MTACDLKFSKCCFETVSEFLVWVGLLTLIKILKSFPEARQKNAPILQTKYSTYSCLCLQQAIIWTWWNPYAAPAAMLALPWKLSYDRQCLHYFGQCSTSLLNNYVLIWDLVYAVMAEVSVRRGNTPEHEETGLVWWCCTTSRLWWGINRHQGRHV